MLKTIFSMLVLVTCSSLQATWSTPVNVSDLGVLITPDQSEVSKDNSNGNAVAIWRTSPAIVLSNALTSTIQVAIKPSGKNWGTPTTISTPGDSANEPDVAMSTNGNAMAVWRDITQGVIQASYYTAKSKTWSAPGTISFPPAGTESVGPNVTIDSKGNAIVIWQETNGDINVRRFVQGTWLSVTTLATNSSIGFPLDMFIKLRLMLLEMLLLYFLVLMAQILEFNMQHIQCLRIHGLFHHLLQLPA